MKSKRFLLLALVFVCLFSVFSCGKKDKNEDTGNEQKPSGSDVTPVGDYIYSGGSQLTLVYNAGTVSAENLKKLKDSLFVKVGELLEADDSIAGSEHEIILGRSERELSKKAYSRLSRMDKTTDDYVGYCIYSDGKSVAIAFDDELYGIDVAENVAIDAFVDNYTTSDSLRLGSGAVKEEVFDGIARQAEIDEKNINARWDAVEEQLVKLHGETLGKESADAMRSYYSLFSDDLVEWFANLYDPVIGGFYYSNSARNTDGYLPDVESTAQALGFLTSSGITNNLAEFIPEEMQKQMVSFVKSLQSPENGHFYHPQWGKELTDKSPARLGRDVGNATRILAYFGAKPTYDAPNGTKGENPIGVAPAASLTERLSASSVSAVSKVIATSDAGVESHLLNEENFRSFLKKYDAKIKTDAYWVGNEFESMATQIVARDKVLKERGEKYSLAKIATDWFTSHLDPETGLWEPYEDNEYDCVNGILKISSAYTKMGYEVPGALNLMDYAIRAITSDADPHHVCCVLNTWYALTVLTQNLRDHSPTAEADIAALRARYIETFPEMVNATFEKFSLFVKDTGTSAGAFSYFQTKTSNTSQGLQVALDNTNEGDVNTSYICTSGVMGHIWDFIGASTVPLYTTSDGMRYIKILSSLGEIIKDKEIEPIPVDFEDVDHIDELKNSSLVDYWLPAGELSVESGKTFGEVSKLLRFSTVSASTDEFHIHLTKPQGSYNAIAFQSDMMLAPEAKTTYNLLFFGNPSSVKAAEMSLVAIPNDGIYITIIDSEEKIKVAECEAWFTLRVEYARLTYSQIILDIFVNGKLITTSAVPYGSESLPAGSVSRVRFAADKNGACDMYFDNLFLEQFIKKLPDGVEEDSGPAESETGIITYDKKPIGAYKNQGWLDWWLPGGTLSIVMAEPYGAASKVLALTTAGKNDDLFQLFITKTESEFNAVGVETDVMFDVSDGSKFKVLIYGGAKGYEMTISVEEESVYVSGAGMTKTKVGNAKEWFKLSFGYAKLSKNMMLFAVIIDNEIVASSSVPYNADQIPEVAEIKRIQFSADKSVVSEGTVYFDNTIMAQLTYELPEIPTEPEEPDEPDTPEIPDEPDEPVTPPTPSDPTVETYEKDDVLDTFKWNNWIDGEIAGSLLEIETGRPYGVASRVYHYRTVSGYKPEITYQFSPNAAANIVSFESDFMFTTSGYLRPEFQIRTSDNKLVYKFYVEANGEKVRLLDTDLNLICELAADGEWFKLGFKFYSDGRGGAKIAFYLNGERIVADRIFETSGNIGTVGRVRFWTETTHTGDIYFDNTQILARAVSAEELPDDQIKLPEIPEEPEIPEDPEIPDDSEDPIVPDPIIPAPEGDSPFESDGDVSDRDWT